MVGRLQRAVDIQLPRTNLIDIQFDNIEFSLKQGRKERKTILKNISGKFRAGDLTAIMGPSGAGKSSLLNILTGFQKDGVKGRISSASLAESETPRLGCDSYRKDSCYILQDDRLNPLFTVQEIMQIAAELKLGQSVSLSVKEYLLNDILDTIGLSQSKDTRCDRLSGGQKKRLSIALELIDNPPIMFLDEPTTGLDSLSSLQCVSMLKALAAGGRTIVCTIHQPSASIYELFDHVYVIAAGRCVYQGDSTNTVAFLEKVDLPCPAYYNPADHLIEVASGDFGDYADRLIETAHESCWRSNNNSEKTDKMSQINQATLEKDNIANIMQQDNNVIKSVVLVNAPSELYRFRILLYKCYLQMYRDWTVTHLKFILHIVVATFIGLLYFGFGDNGYQSVANVGYMLVSLVYLSYTSMMPAVLKFPSEIPVLKKERFNNWYQLRTYYAAYLVSSIPIQIIFTLVYCMISYVMSRQIMEWDRCCQFMVIVVVCTLISEGVGVFFGTIVNPVNGTFLSCILLALFLVLAGFLMPFSQMSSVWYAISYVSYMAYGIDAMLQSMYGYNRPNLSCPSNYEYCHYTQPTALLKDLGIDPTGARYWNDLAVLIVLFVVMKVVGFATLKRKLTRAS